MSNKLDMLKKIKALAERGIDGEKENAQRILESLMEKYDISDDELDAEEIITAEFWHHNVYERKILIQLIYSQIADPVIYTYTRTYTGRKIRNKIGLKCTKAQSIEIQFLYDFYVQLWYSEVDLFMKAYISKHDLYPINPTGCSEDNTSIEDLCRISMMKNGLSDQSPIRRLESGEED